MPNFRKFYSTNSLDSDKRSQTTKCDETCATQVGQNTLIQFHRIEGKWQERQFVSRRILLSETLLKSWTRRHSKFGGERTNSGEELVE